MRQGHLAVATLMLFLSGCGSASPSISTDSTWVDKYQHLTDTLISIMDSVILLDRFGTGMSVSYPNFRVCITPDDMVMFEPREHFLTDTLAIARLVGGEFRRLLGTLAEARFFSSLEGDLSNGAERFSHTGLTTIMVRLGQKEKSIASDWTPIRPGGAQHFSDLAKLIINLAPTTWPSIRGQRMDEKAIDHQHK